jgi:EAL domain-containing protein (putative c-di-GMP-specific phosphodiesterase class I)
VPALVNIAAARAMTTTAEGVETEEQRQAPGRLECPEMLGYVFSKPLAAADIRRLLSSGRGVVAEIA